MADWFSQNAPQAAAPPPASGDWFAKNAPPPPKPPEPSPVAKAGKAFAEGIGLPALLDIIGGANRTGTPQDVAARAERQKAAVQGIVQGIIGEPGRVRQELTNAIDAIVAGNPRATAHHLLSAVPLVGEPINRAAQSFASGDPASGVGQTAAIMLPFAHEPIQAGVTRAAEVVAPAARTAADVTAAAVKAGGRDVAVGAGKTAVGAALAKAGPLGEVADVLAGLPIAKSGIKQMGRGVRAGYIAGKEALARPGVTVEQGPPPVQIRGLLPPAPEVIVPEAPALPPDPSFVRAVPAQYPDVIPETLRAKPAASDIAAQLEASMRAETLTDYLVRNKVPAAMLDEFGPEQWDMVSRQAGVKPPTLEDVAAIRGNLAEYQAAANDTAETVKLAPAEAKADFEQRRATRSARSPKPATEPPADVEAQLADSLAAVEKGERPVAPAPAEQPRAATASDKRVEAYAQHFAADPGTAIADIEPLTKLPDFPKLGRALEIDGALAPGEAERIAARVKELRGGGSTASAEAAAPAAIIEADVESTPTIGQPTGEQSGSPRATVSGSREPTNPVARGSATTVRVPGQKTGYEGQYSVRELDDVHASHNPHTFEKNPNYQLRNDRDYSNPVNKERIVVNSKGDTFDPAYLMDSPDATNGAPVIDADGNVIGGNSRAMVLDRVYKYNQTGADAYKAELARKAPQLGIDPEQIAGMKRPVLVRELSDAGLNKQRAITDLNKTGTAALTAEEQATADARMMTPAAADYLSSVIDAEGADVTLSDVLSSSRGPTIVNRLIEDGVFTMQERPKLINEKTKAVTPAGKERISKMLLGQAFEESDQMGRTPAEIKNKLERAVSPIMQSSQKRGFDIRPTVREALDVLEQARMHDVTQMRDLISQEGMFGDVPKFSEQAVDLAQFIQDSKPTAIGQAFRRYVANADPTFFGESTPAEAFADAFGTTAPPSTLRDLMQPKAAEPPKAAAPRKRRSKPVR